MLKSQNKSIGIFGGSFDPPHIGHVKITKIALKKLKLKKIYWLVTKKNPFKKKTFFSIQKRVLEAKKATKKLKNVKVVYIDDKIGSSRMIKAIYYFLKVKKEANLYLILGSDNLITFHKWTSWKKIAKLAKIAVFSRKGYDIKSNKSIVVKYLKKSNITYIKNKHFNISSSSIRKKLKSK